MSTRSQIGILHEDGSITAHYCHSDGYFSWNGRILHEHYQDRAKIQQLIALGDMSVLYAEIGEKHDFDWRSKVKSDKWANDPRNDMCRFYGRDRGEKGVEPQRFDDLSSMAPTFEEYLYLWVEAEGHWIGASCPYGGDAADLKWHKLSDLAPLNWVDRDEHGNVTAPVIDYPAAVNVFAEMAQF